MGGTLKRGRGAGIIARIGRWYDCTYRALVYLRISGAGIIARIGCWYNCAYRVLVYQRVSGAVDSLVYRRSITVGNMRPNRAYILANSSASWEAPSSAVEALRYGRRNRAVNTRPDRASIPAVFKRWVGGTGLAQLWR